MLEIKGGKVSDKPIKDMTTEELILEFRIRCTISGKNQNDAISGKSFKDKDGNLFEPVYGQFNKFINGYLKDEEGKYEDYLRAWLSADETTFESRG
jgi:hypothetical protein